MSDLIKQEVKRLLLFLLLVSVVGWLFNHPASALDIGLFSYIVLHLRNINKLSS